ncbi:hypothetical protein LTR35_000648 [Friedmanniomyces endolithicus]|uniref:Uncharacterized protein n=1 Tax=Friedmanniomyces endolithicus TaxID=329885 RepID=A0AAN6F8H6_9PEZI|nr:hypothetical protein LTS00_012167 [Friedmanniomyces endolithicus]KAK0292617.1 hypothetical protein LTR35_000648 [Friedmanniomyces endolithicus]KAK0305967.1 hypothetical protein LTR82_016523 [Friedmanniomyces endolithicus]KAK1007642.1 hypothetical protein LTR54_006368 [Friedmanniomyces endolithicus]
MNAAKRKQADEDDGKQPRPKTRRSNRLSQVKPVNYSSAVDRTDSRTPGDDDKTREKDDSSNFEMPEDEGPAPAKRIRKNRRRLTPRAAVKTYIEAHYSIYNP